MLNSAKLHVPTSKLICGIIFWCHSENNRFPWQLLFVFGERLLDIHRVYLCLSWYVYPHYTHIHIYLNANRLLYVQPFPKQIRICAYSFARWTPNTHSFVFLERKEVREKWQQKKRNKLVTMPEYSYSCKNLIKFWRVTLNGTLKTVSTTSPKMRANERRRK